MPATAVVQPVKAEPAKKPRRPTPAERARRKLLREQAEEARQLAQLEARMAEIAEVRSVMESDDDLSDGRFTNTFDRWESLCLQAINDRRVPSRRCSTLPGWAYEQKVCAQYAGCDLSA